MRWRPVTKPDIRELGGPMKRLTPKGFLLANPGKQVPDVESEGVECGVCHVVIYRSEGSFDTQAFLAARKKHYEASPGCKTPPRGSV